MLGLKYWCYLAVSTYYDEKSHTQLCYAWAVRYAGKKKGRKEYIYFIYINRHVILHCIISRSGLVSLITYYISKIMGLTQSQQLPFFLLHETESKLVTKWL